ncbi:PadR family transcriptional regulator [Streptomyces sp. BBFR2]|uniref:PadR family transcriptional regulator n=1 Tax=Streptomyces sp. BBFR2 TaxID=3372854 RepID=UPI0037DA2D3C
MSLPYAILTALLEKPSSGLELTRRFDKSIGYFWSATHQQIYRELGKLEAAGLIRALPAAQPARGQKKEFEVLPSGRAALTAWAAEPQDPKPPRDALLLRMRAAAVVGHVGLDEELRRHLDLHRRQLAEYTAIEERDFRSADAPGDRLRRLVLRAGIDLETFWITWLTSALAEVAEMTEPAETAEATDAEGGGGAENAGGAGSTRDTAGQDDA